DLARQVLHAAVRRHDDIFFFYELESLSDSVGDLLRSFHGHVREIKATDHDFLAPQLRKHGAIELGLSGLDRDLLARAAGELGKEGIAGGPRVDDRRVAEADMHGGGSLDAL